MNELSVRLRVAAPDDAPALRDIYAPYVEKTAVSFEYEVPTAGEFRRRMEETLARYPYLAAEGADGALLGYACTHTFIAREAYDHSAETTIYLAPGARGRGLGRRLYGALEELSRAQGIANLYACIGEPQGEDDEYLTHGSTRFHERMGFRRVGVFERCGYKFGRWYNMVWAEKLIAPHGAACAPFVPFPALDAAAVERALR